MRKRRGILIAVIVIIVIITGLFVIVMAPGSMVIPRARAAQSNALMVGLKIGIECFKLEYNQMPPTEGPSGGSPWQRTRGVLLDALTGNDPK
jgi:hypothetical protein